MVSNRGKLGWKMVTGTLLMLATTTTFAQNKSPFNLPGTIPVPEWVKQVDWQHPNIHSIDSVIGVYNAKPGAEEEREEYHEEGEDEDFFEEPYLNAYIRWRNEMEPFIQPDGKINYDPDHARRELLRSLEMQNKPANTGTAAKTTSASWALLGPVETYKVGTGELRNYQSNIYCIAIAPSNPNVLYAGSETQTFYRSADKGLHWTSVSESLTSAGSKSIAVDPWNENIVYTYDGSANLLMKTSDGGTTWTALTAYTGGTGNAIGINRNTGRILITGSTTIYYSDNAGTTWTAAAGSTVGGTLYDLAISPGNPDTVYASGSTASSGGTLVLLRSVNGGTSFTNVSGAVAGSTTSGSRLGVSAANSNYVYCVNLGGSVPPSIIKSTDRGASWGVTVTSTTTGLTGSSATTGLGMSNGQGFYDLSIVVSPLNANHVIAGTTTTYKSTDGGLNFSPVGGYSGPMGIHPDLQQAVALGGDTYLATDGGVNHSSDFFTTPANWSVRNYGLRSADYWGFGQGWDEDIVVGGRYHNGDAALFDVYGVGKSLALGGGEDATGHVYHGYSRTAGFRDIGNVILPATLTGAAQFSATNVPNTMWPQDNYYGQFASKLMVDPRYSNIFYLGKDSTLWRSSNRGFSYMSVHDFGSKVWRFDIARSNPSVMYVCATGGVFKTTDGGTTWSSITLPVTWQYYNSDIAVNPLNENEVFLCMANGAAANKVFRSIDGGTSWTNITGTALNGKKVAFLQFHGGTASGVYAITNTKPSKVYYKDTAMSDWVNFSDGLPASLNAREGGLIFYRDNKMRLAGNCSIWETPLYATGAPVAQPMADKQRLGCARDTVNFFDYSMYNYSGASRTWSFPGALWVSSTTDLRPQVVYPGAGAYSVSLTVTNALGQTHTRTIDSMIIVQDDNCTPDTVAGLCLQMNGTNQTIDIGTANINSNTFSISAWIQPYGLQKSFSQIVGHRPFPGSGSTGFGFGFKFAGYTPNLVLCYTDNIVTYTNTSSLICDSTRWNYVVLTYSPSGVVLYLNGIADTVNNGPMPVIDLSQAPFVINLDVHNGQGSKYKGAIDEVKIYDYTLSQEEVREKMHLITDPATETGLLKYYQFNQYDPISGSVYDMKANFNTFVPATNIISSTAPVSSGRVYRAPMVNAAGLNSFSAANMDLYLPPSGSYPDGEMVAFHLFSNPDTLPGSTPPVPGYFIINNYGNNQLVSPPDSMVMSGLNIGFPEYSAGDFRIYKRHACDFGNTWSAELDTAAHFVYAAAGSSLSWHNNYYDTVFTSQYVVRNNDTTNYTGTHDPVKTFTIMGPYPNPAKEWTQVNIYVPGAVQGAATISLTDIAGRQVLRTAERLSSGTNTLLLHLPRLSEGLYVLTVEIPGWGKASSKLEVDR